MKTLEICCCYTTRGVIIVWLVINIALDQTTSLQGTVCTMLNGSLQLKCCLVGSLQCLQCLSMSPLCMSFFRHCCVNLYSKGCILSVTDNTNWLSALIFQGTSYCSTSLAAPIARQFSIPHYRKLKWHSCPFLTTKCRGQLRHKERQAFRTKHKIDSIIKLSSLSKYM